MRVVPDTSPTRGARALVLLVALVTAIGACGLALAGGSTASTASTASAGSATAAARPNVLLVVTDDQAHALFTRALMPTVFSELVDRGVTFDRAYVETPLCCPSRSQILTGLTATHTGVDTNSEPLPETRPTIALALQDAGYRTMLAGKYLNGDSCAPKPGWTRWVCLGPKPSSYSLRDPMLMVDGTWRQARGPTLERLADEVEGFIRRTPRSTPFFVMLTPTSPHLPADDPRAGRGPVPRHRPPSYDEPAGEGKPRHLRRGSLTAYEQGQIDAEHAAMTRAVPPLDRSIGRVLAALGDRSRDTIVILVSDNGYLYGEHRLLGKTSPYEESVRVPLVIRFPRLTGRAARSQALVQNLDLAPTIAELAGIPWRADGRSLVPLLRDPASSVRDEALIEHCQASPEPCNPQGAPPAVPGYVGVVTRTHKLVRYASGDTELYDLAADPHELVNLAGAPSAAAVQADLQRRLDRLRAEPELPVVTIASGGGPAPTRSPVFHFFTPSLGATLECRLVRPQGGGGAWQPCASGRAYRWLGDGTYRFETRARDARGALSAVAARPFTISTSGPPVQILAGPPDPSATGDVGLRFATPVGGASLECRLTRGREVGAWQACREGTRAFDGLPDGTYAFEVRARAGRAVTTPPAAWPFRISSSGPGATFTTAPPAFGAGLSARFAFTLSIPAEGPVLCTLDDAPAVDCSEGTFEQAVGEGSHRLTVRARDAFGHEGTTTHAFVVDRTRPAFSTVSLTPATITPDGDGVDDVLRIEGTFSEPSSVFVRIKTPGGLLVFRYPVWRPAAGFAATWDGRDLEGDGLPPGAYPYAIIATDRAGNTKRVTGVVQLA